MTFSRIPLYMSRIIKLTDIHGIIIDDDNQMIPNDLIILLRK